MALRACSNTPFDKLLRNALRSTSNAPFDELRVSGVGRHFMLGGERSSSGLSAYGWRAISCSTVNEVSYRLSASPAGSPKQSHPPAAGRVGRCFAGASEARSVACDGCQGRSRARPVPPAGTAAGVRRASPAKQCPTRAQHRSSESSTSSVAAPSIDYPTY